MLGIFKDERRELATLAPNPCRTGRILPWAASQSSCVGPATQRRPLLTHGKIRSRLDSNLIVHRP